MKGREGVDWWFVRMGIDGELREAMYVYVGVGLERGIDVLEVG